MRTSDVVGIVAGVLTTIAFVPQAMKTWTTRSAQDFSLKMLVLFTAGVGLWLVYGVMIGAMPVVVPNLVTLALAGFILTVKLRHG